MIKFLSKKKNRNKGKLVRGFTLVETLIALAIFSVSIAALLGVLANGVTDTTYAKQKMVATYLAQEGIEQMRNLRDNDMFFNTNNYWDAFTNDISNCVNNDCGFDNYYYNGNPANPNPPFTDPNFLFPCSPVGSKSCELYIDGDTNSYDADSANGTDSGFRRTVRFDPSFNTSNEVKVTSTVSWTQGSGSYSISFSEYLFHWTEL